MICWRQLELVRGSTWTMRPRVIERVTPKWVACFLSFFSLVRRNGELSCYPILTMVFSRNGIIILGRVTENSPRSQHELLQTSIAFGSGDS